ncbi:aminoglycoside adenylyltransferase family protein [Eleftheria terrae]|uniref:aminoglycoside adenylyltransferase family protein n=1 Tax=Eleftheria terrae TaxID=1597781 RepID=UPI00263AAD45|nr:aminoglycoside adenylyltransferase family protein [Eleftheria terrae]WKB56150.1 aminoglycoside adenylyltransferase family protein [Eleftheria terrae]
MERSTPPEEIAPQLAGALTVIEGHLAGILECVHLFGSAVEGGLKPHSDIDLLVTVRTSSTEATRQAVMSALLGVSAPPGASAGEGRLRPLEVTVIALPDIVPWRHPARRQLQFGEWLREELQAGHFEPPMPDHDLAILLTKVRQRSMALRGPEAATVLPPVPPADLMQALLDTVAQWRTPADWAGDERNVVLALARICFTAATGEIASKDGAAVWLLERLPATHRAVLADAKAAYLGQSADHLASRPADVAAWILHVKAAVTHGPRAAS